MKKLFIISIIAMLVFGCKTTKSVLKESVKTNLTTHYDSTQTSNINKHIVSDSTVLDTSFLSDRVTEVITQTNYSLPDSTGKQAVLSTIVTDRTRDIKNTKDIKTDVNTNTSINAKQVVKVNKDAQLKSETKAKTTTTSTLIPWWVYLLPLLIGLLGYLGFRLWKITAVSIWIKKILNIG